MFFTLSFFFFPVLLYFPDWHTEGSYLTWSRNLKFWILDGCDITYSCRHLHASQFSKLFYRFCFWIYTPSEKTDFSMICFLFRRFAFNFSVFFFQIFYHYIWLIYTVGQKRFSVIMVKKKILDLLWNLRLLIVSWMCEWNDCLDVERER